MKVNLLHYKNSLNFIEVYLKVNKDSPFQDKLNSISMATYIPLVAVAYYIAKVEGMTEEIQNTIRMLNDFYKYDEIIGVNELMGDNSNGL